MKIYVIIDTYDDGIWITEDTYDNPLVYATMELAEQNKKRIDDEERAGHEAREKVRYERWSKMQAARTILEANAFDEIDEALSTYGRPFSPYEFKCKTSIVALEVVE